MTKEGFLELQSRQAMSGLGLLEYLRGEGIPYSNYTYWRRKYIESRPLPPAPVRLSGVSPSASPSEGVTLLLPNGIRAHFTGESEQSALDFLRQSLEAHVQP